MEAEHWLPSGHRLLQTISTKLACPICRSHHRCQPSSGAGLYWQAAVGQRQNALLMLWRAVAVADKHPRRAVCSILRPLHRDPIYCRRTVAMRSSIQARSFRQVALLGSRALSQTLILRACS
jgi:hypothetical protein